MNPPVPVEDIAGPPADPDELRLRIAYTRGELAETVEALAAKTDVKARAVAAAAGASGTVTGEIQAAERRIATGYRAIAGRTPGAVGQIITPRSAGLLLAGVTALLVAIMARRHLR